MTTIFILLLLSRFVVFAVCSPPAYVEADIKDGLFSSREYETDPDLRNIVEQHHQSRSTQFMTGNVARIQRRILRDAVSEHKSYANRSRYPRTITDEDNNNAAAAAPSAPPPAIVPKNSAQVNLIEAIYNQPFTVECRYDKNAAAATHSFFFFKLENTDDATEYEAIPSPNARLPDEDDSVGVAYGRVPHATFASEGVYDCNSFPPTIIKNYRGKFPNKSRVIVNVVPQRVAIRSVQQVLQLAGSLTLPTAISSSNDNRLGSLFPYRSQNAVEPTFAPALPLDDTAGAVLGGSNRLVMDEDATVRVACIVYNAKPAAHIQWFFDDKPVAGFFNSSQVDTSDPYLLKAQEVSIFTREFPANQTDLMPKTPSNSSKSLYNTISVIQFRPTRQDFGKLLKCQALHDKIWLLSDSQRNSMPFSDSVMLDVQYEPIARAILITTGSENIVVDEQSLIREGDSATFTCEVDANPLSATRKADSADRLKFKWMLNGTFVQDAHEKTLLITNFSRSQNDRVLTCQANNRLGSSQVSRRIRVAYPPTFTSSAEYAGQSDAEQLVPTSVRGTVSLECPVEGNPKPAVYWLRVNPQSSNSTQTPLPRAQSSQSFVIPSMSEKDFGLYKCVATVANGQRDYEWPEIARYFRIIPKRGPHIMPGFVKNIQSIVLQQQPPQIQQEQNASSSVTYSAALGSPADVECTVFGAPLPYVISWTHPNGTVIARASINSTVDDSAPRSRFSASTIQLSRYTLRALLRVSTLNSERDFGIYNCSARNEYGLAVSHVVLEQRAYVVQTLLIAGACAIAGMLAVVLLLFCFIRKCVAVLHGRGGRGGRKRLKSQPSVTATPVLHHQNSGFRNSVGKELNSVVAAANTGKNSSSSSSGGSVSSESVEMKSATNSTQADNNSLSGFPLHNTPGSGEVSAQPTNSTTPGKTSRLSSAQHHHAYHDSTLSNNTPRQRGALYQATAQQQRQNSTKFYNLSDGDQHHQLHHNSNDDNAIFIANLDRRRTADPASKTRSTSTTTVDDDEMPHDGDDASELSTIGYNNGLTHVYPHQSGGQSPAGAIMALAQQQQQQQQYFRHPSSSMTAGAADNAATTINLHVPNHSPMLISMPLDEIDLHMMQQQQQQQQQAYFAYSNGDDEFDPDAYDFAAGGGRIDDGQPFVTANASISEQQHLYDHPPPNSGAPIVRNYHQQFSNPDNYFMPNDAAEMPQQQMGRRQSNTNFNARHLSLQRNVGSNFYHHHPSSYADDDNGQITGLPPPSSAAVDGGEAFVPSFSQNRRFYSSAANNYMPANNNSNNTATMPAFRYQPPRPAGGSLLSSGRQQQQSKKLSNGSGVNFLDYDAVGAAGRSARAVSGRAHSAVPGGGGNVQPGRDMFVVPSQLGTNV